MKVRELCLDCRYYEGEDRCPDARYSEYWNKEHEWVTLMLAHAPELETYMGQYSNRNLDFFDEEDGTPLSLKALLFYHYHQESIGRFFSIS
jgi:hypothetical protein